MSQETESSDDLSAHALETALASQSPADLKAAEAAVAEEWNEGDVILDLYEVKGVLGEGGFGKVYRVRHKGWNIDLAVKTPRLDRLDEGGKENFRNEAETWVNLGLHPHTVSCYYVRDLGGIPRVFAEYVEGGTLSDWIRSCKLYDGGKEEALKRILDISIQFAWGLHYAHEQGLVHQDVKPGNVMMTTQGVAKVTDFGLAKGRSIASGKTENDSGESAVVASGGMTPAYASPEQSAARSLSRTTDIWSWAVSVLEMFTGEVTWMSGSAAADALEGYLDAGEEAPSIPAMPDGVGDLLRACFKDDPDERPKNMLEAVSRLQEVYRSIAGEEYSRKLLKAAKAIAAGLNNRAVSLLDLGKQVEAEKLWQEALQVEPGHLEATYNSGLIRWRAARIADDAVINEMEEARNSHQQNWIADYLLGLVHLERGDSEAATKAVESIQGVHANRREVKAALTVALARRPQSKELVGHSDSVRSVSMSAEGKYALSGSSDGTMKLWKIATGQCVWTYECHERSVEVVSLSADGQDAGFARSLDRSFSVLKTFQPNPMRTLEGHGEDTVEAISLSADGQYVLSSSYDGIMNLWDVATGQRVQTFRGDTDPLETVSLSGDGKYALSGNRDGTIKLWDAFNGQRLRTFEGHSRKVTSVVLSAGVRYALTGSDDCTLKLWEVDTGRCLRTFEGHSSRVTSVSLSADARYALSGSLDSTVKLWEAATGRCLRTFEWHPAGVTSVSLSADGKYALSGGARSILSGSSDRTRTLRFWEVEAQYFAPLAISQIVSSETASEREEVFVSNVALARSALSNGDVGSAVKHTRHARSLVGYERRPEVIDLWVRFYSHLPRKALNGAWEKLSVRGHASVIRSVSFSADGKHALSGSNDKTLKLWEVTTGRCLRTFEGHTGEVLSIGLAPDSKHALSGSHDHTLTLWQVATGECRRIFLGHKSGVLSVCLSADGKWALSGAADKTLKLWEVMTDRCLRTFKGHTESVASVSLSADGRYALSGSHDKTLKLWDVTTGRCLRTFEGHTGAVLSTGLTSDSKCALSGSYDKTLKLWDVATGRCLRTFEGHTGKVLSTGLTPDSKYALSGSSDTTLKLWDVTTGRCLRTFEGHTGPVYSVSLSADGKYALSGSEELKLWMLDWELDDRQTADWDEAAREYLHTFLRQHRPYAYSLQKDHEPSKKEITLSLTRTGIPTWTDKDFDELLYTLGCSGFGWLRPEGVRRELDNMAAELVESGQDSIAKDIETNRPWWKRIWKT